MNNLRLKYGSTTQSLAAWGFTEKPVMVLRSRAASTFTVTLAGGDPAADPAIPFEGAVTIYDGSTIIFQGRRTDVNGNARGKNRSQTMVFSDPWYDLERTIYKQVWNQAGGGTFTSSRVFLFQAISTPSTPWTQWTVAQQITDIIDWAASAGANVQAGTIDPALLPPVYYMKAPTCAQAINKCIESLADVATHWDYTSNPPTLHVRIRQNRTPVILPYANGFPLGSGTQVHLSTDIRPRPDLQIPVVQFDYQSTGDVSGISYVSFAKDTYPIGGNPNVLRGLTCPVDLRGATRHVAKGAITAASINVLSTGFWTDKKNDLAKSNISGLTIVDVGAGVNAGSGHPNGVYVKDTSGSNISLATYPYEFKNGQVAPWMVDGSGNPIKVIEAIVTAVVSYTVKDVANGVVVTHNVTNQPITTRVKLTNSPVGTTTYSATASASDPELPLANLAYLYWCSVNNVPINAPGGVITPPGTPPAITNPYNLQWEGEHTIIEQGNISTYYDCGNTLNLDDSDGGNVSWLTMAADIYEVRYDFYSGTTTIRFGPHKYLSADQFFQQAMMFVTRIAIENPNIRSTGQDSAGAGTQLGNDTRLEDTHASDASGMATAGLVGPNIGSGGTANLWSNIHDAGSGATGYDGLPAWLAQNLKVSDGTVVSGSNQIKIKLSDLTGSGMDTGIVFSIRVITYKDDGCNPKYRYILGLSQEFSGTPPGTAPT